MQRNILYKINVVSSWSQELNIVKVKPRMHGFNTDTAQTKFETHSFLPKGEKKSYDFKIARQGEVTLLHIPTSPSESAKSHLPMPSRWRDEHTPWAFWSQCSITSSLICLWLPFLPGKNEDALSSHHWLSQHSRRSPFQLTSSLLSLLFSISFCLNWICACLQLCMEARG